jgi:hypothetical protein
VAVVATRWFSSTISPGFSGAFGGSPFTEASEAASSPSRWAMVVTVSPCWATAT